MIEYIEVILAFDVSKEKRKSLVESAQDYGLIPLQKNLLWGKLMSHEIDNLNNVIQLLELDRERDKVILAPAQIKYNSKSVGFDDFYFYEPGEDLII